MTKRIDLWTYGATTLEQVQDAWLYGKDFVVAQTGMHCSIRDYPDLRDIADIINLRWLGNENYEYYNIWIHPLTGVTTYI